MQNKRKQTQVVGIVVFSATSIEIKSHTISCIEAVPLDLASCSPRAPQPGSCETAPRPLGSPLGGAFFCLMAPERPDLNP
jgi:hypothetical protein